VRADRDTNGRFLPGHPGGPGRPRRAIELDYLAALAETVSLPRWRKIVQRAVADAEEGDARARAWLGFYLAGKPTGEALRLLAAAERVDYDPVAEDADTLGQRKALLDRFNHREGRAGGTP
jgi:hypothetical protein